MFNGIITALRKFIFCYTITADPASFIRLLINTKRYRYAKKPVVHPAIPVPYHLRLNGKRKTVFLRTYAGDIAIFYEIFWQKVYKLPWPGDTIRGYVVDLGANTGMASLFFSAYYSIRGVYAVEADRFNMDLLLRNLSPEISAGRVKALHAAAFTEDTTVYMQRQEKAYNTAVTSEVTDMPVRAISMDTLCSMFEPDRIGLLKIDIEGSEEILFSKNTEWLEKVNIIVMEIHGDGYRSVCETLLRTKGFVIYEPGDSALHSTLLWAIKQEIMQ
ncbi:FkbM family methyltransferase [Agriterribacter sp.]|uniref:FkbM family methyltransferase n=1 Tax=Agriterribacter sp. TaxID=2821509 RepID=UPI002B849D08|nr:FkbM family methyltransferase [Agriterribacter sp.]HRP55337.1 FkbM family methyltransferase [Agriterribacter sp.]